MAQMTRPGSEFSGLSVCVAGLGVSGPPAARALAALGATVTAVDSRADAPRRELAAELADAGITVLLGDGPAGPAAVLPAGTDLVVTSPGWRPDAPLLAAASAAGVPVIGDVELAWRLRPVLADGTRQQWLAVTGTNGKTTTVRMLAAMLAAAGHRSIAAGNVGTSAVTAVTEADPYEVIAVELSSFQLHWSSTLRPFAAVVLNVAAHHLDWHGDIGSYARDKGRVYAPGAVAVYNADDPRSGELAAMAREPAGVVAFRLGAPGAGELGRPCLRRCQRRRWRWRRQPPWRGRRRWRGHHPGRRQRRAARGAAQHLRCPGRRRAGPRVRGAAGRGRRRADGLPAGPAPDQPGRPRRRGGLHR
jgi:UDP-N-acetylmuramoylalanine--D-glutamate ligase